MLGIVGENEKRTFLCFLSVLGLRESERVCDGQTTEGQQAGNGRGEGEREKVRDFIY